MVRRGKHASAGTVARGGTPLAAAACAGALAAGLVLGSAVAGATGAAAPAADGTGSLVEGTVGTETPAQGTAAVETAAATDDGARGDTQAPPAPSAPEPASGLAGAGKYGRTVKNDARLDDEDMALFKAPDGGLPASVTLADVRAEVLQELKANYILSVKSVVIGEAHVERLDGLSDDERNKHVTYYGETDIYSWEYAVETGSGTKLTVRTHCFDPKTQGALTPKGRAGKNVMTDLVYTWPAWVSAEEDRLAKEKDGKQADGQQAQDGQAGTTDQPAPASREGGE